MRRELDPTPVAGRRRRRRERRGPVREPAGPRGSGAAAGAERASADGGADGAPDGGGVAACGGVRGPRRRRAAAIRPACARRQRPRPARPAAIRPAGGRGWPGSARRTRGRPMSAASGCGRRRAQQRRQRLQGEQHGEPAAHPPGQRRPPNSHRPHVRAKAAAGPGSPLSRCRPRSAASSSGEAWKTPVWMLQPSRRPSAVTAADVDQLDHGQHAAHGDRDQRADARSCCPAARDLHRPGEGGVADAEPGRGDQGRQRRHVAERLRRADGEDVVERDRS